MSKRLIILLVSLVIVSLGMSLFGCSAQAPAAPKPAPAPAPAPAPKPAAESAADFYKGKNITFVSPQGAGGGGDLTTRLVATFLAPMIGAQIGVVNDTTAAGMTARNAFSKTTKPDGLNLLGDAAAPANWLLDAEGVSYELDKWSGLGGVKAAVSGIVVATGGPYTTVETLQKGKNLNFGATGASAIPTLSNMAANEILGLDAKIVIGFPSAAARRLALEQMEIDGLSNTIDTATKEAENGKTKVLFATSAERDPNFKDIPAISEFVKLTDRHKMLIDAVPLDYKQLFAPPGTPKDRIEYLRTNIDKVFLNKDFQTAAAKISGLWPGALTGAEHQQYLDRLVKNKPESKKIFSDLMAKYIKQ